jgi:hypothetical protein
MLFLFSMYFDYLPRWCLAAVQHATPHDQSVGVLDLPVVEHSGPII